MLRCARYSVLIWLSVVTAATAHDIYVSNNLGNDRNNGLYAFPSSDGSGPVQTITQALKIAQTTDRIVLHKTDVPYRGDLCLIGSRHSGTQALPFEIYGNGAIIDGSIPVPLGVWEHFRDHVFRFRPWRQTYIRLFRDGKPLAARKVDVEATAVPQLEPLQWCLLRGHVYLRVEDGKLPDDYRLTQTGHQVGITLYRVRNVVVDNLVLQGFHLDGINVHDLAEGVTLTQLTCRGNGRSGIFVGGASRATISNCLLGDNGHAQVQTEGPSETAVRNCDILDHSAPAFISKGRKLTVDEGN